MKIIDAKAVAAAAPYKDIIEALRDGFRQDIVSPVRHHHQPSKTSNLLLMPAWTSEYVGLKIVMQESTNAARGLPTIQANYLLIDSRTGETLAMMDGTEITRRRTAAASALAADYLARGDARTLTLCGAGALGEHFVRAHAAVRRIKTVFIHNRSPQKAEALAQQLSREGFDASVTSDLANAVGQADIVSSVTTSTAPIVLGAWLTPGTHVDLAGAFKPSMRETDGEVVARSRVYVDTRDGAEAEAGDLLQARAEGRFDFATVQGDLADLCRGKVQGRRSEQEITLFKSCGTAIEDLAAAIMIYNRT